MSKSSPSEKKFMSRIAISGKERLLAHSYQILRLLSTSCTKITEAVRWSFTLNLYNETQRSDNTKYGIFRDPINLATFAEEAVNPISALCSLLYSYDFRKINELVSLFISQSIDLYMI